MKACNDFVIVTDETGLEKKTETGIVTERKDRPVAQPTYTGTVVAAGPGNRSQTTGKCVPLQVSEGDIVRFVMLAPYPFEVGEKKFMAMRATNIICIED